MTTQNGSHIKLTKRLLFGFISLLVFLVTGWASLLLNPEWVYSRNTQFDHITVYHSELLDANTIEIIQEVVEIISTSSLYREGFWIDLCLNDNSIYSKLYPLKKGAAYAFLNKTVIYDCKADFSENGASSAWRINDYEKRTFRLSYLLAHEFVHNLQNGQDPFLYFKVESWKLEGHAEYIARQWQNDQMLKSKIGQLILEEAKQHVGIPVIKLEDGTIQNLAYFKYGLVVQYLMEEEDLDFQAICRDKREFDVIYRAMMVWSRL